VADGGSAPRVTATPPLDPLPPLLELLLDVLLPEELLVVELPLLDVLLPEELLLPPPQPTIMKPAHTARRLRVDTTLRLKG
jgi:hypothetical protein